jgi:hypothetical protein
MPGCAEVAQNCQFRIYVPQYFEFSSVKTTVQIWQYCCLTTYPHRPRHIWDSYHIVERIYQYPALVSLFCVISCRVTAVSTWRSFLKSVTANIIPTLASVWLVLGQELPWYNRNQCGIFNYRISAIYPVL